MNTTITTQRNAIHDTDSVRIITPFVARDMLDVYTYVVIPTDYDAADTHAAIEDAPENPRGVMYAEDEDDARRLADGIRDGADVIEIVPSFDPQPLIDVLSTPARMTDLDGDLFPFGNPGEDDAESYEIDVAFVGSILRAHGNMGKVDSASIGIHLYVAHPADAEYEDDLAHGAIDAMDPHAVY